MNNQANQAIACTVTSCQYHSSTCNNCTLDRIQVGTHECNPTEKQCTDCQSFKQK